MGCGGGAARAGGATRPRSGAAPSFPAPGVLASTIAARADDCQNAVFRNCLMPLRNLLSGELIQPF